MGFLQSLSKGIKSVENTIAVGAGGKVAPPNYATTIQPGHQLSPAVEAQNAAPVQNQWNAQGQPTQEVLGNPGDVVFPDGGHAPQKVNPLVYNPHFASLLAQLSAGHVNRPQQYSPQQAMSVAQSAIPMPGISPSLQGANFNPGGIPLQSSVRTPQPQFQAFNSPQQRNANPQNPYQMY